MANTQVEIVANGKTTLATAGKYCDRNIDVNVAVPANGITPTGSKDITENGTYDVTIYAEVVVDVQAAQPTQFTNYYDPANVTLDKRVGYSSSAGLTREADTESNIIRIPYHKTAGAPFVMRMRGLGTVRSRLSFVCFGEDGTSVPAYGNINSYTTLSYDEYGDAVLTGTGTPFTSREWFAIEFNFQYPGLSSATAALTGPIITINEPIGNGGHAE